MTTIEIGTTPANEECAQTGITPNSLRPQRIECSAYAKALIRKYGEPPEGSFLNTKTHNHDFGSYAEVVYSCKQTKTER